MSFIAVHVESLQVVNNEPIPFAFWLQSCLSLHILLTKHCSWPFTYVTLTSVS